MLSSFLRRFGRRATFPLPSPATPLFVIGDVHGCLVQLEKLLQQTPSGHRVVLVGDYVDRGEYSADVLKLVSERLELTCLMGNHEEMLLRFLKNPEEQGARWLRYGGLQTLASFGVRGARPEMTAPELKDCRDSLKDAMGEQLCRWLGGLRTSLQSGNILITHAGADPQAAADQQTDKTLIWGHQDFQSIDRRDGVWVVHGHTIVSQANASRGRIAIDTGAFATGVLSAVCLDGSEPRFVTARP